MRRASLLFAPLLALVACADAPTAPEPAADLTAQMAKGGRAGPIGTVYVSGQGLYYDTFVSAERLPPHGRFQKLENGVTEFGPGDPGYLGGRWWIDDGDGVMGPEDTYLLCPLLPPGRATP